MKTAGAMPTRQELEILKIVWRLGQATVRDVYEELRRRRSLAYTTVMTTMNIMEAKGYLARRLRGRAYVYRAAAGRRAMVRRMVRDFIRRVFDGSTDMLLAHLVDEGQVSPQQWQRVARLIRAR